MIRYVLGVDAAWTEGNPSGVALLRIDEEKKRIQLVKAARSYQEFCNENEINWSQSATGTAPDFKTLLKYCEDNKWRIALVALDIPLSPKAIRGRRVADEEISRKYGGRGASTHSPSETRPGQLSSDIYQQLLKCGFSWARNLQCIRPSFIEVYPHVAIIELFDYTYRVPYKVEKRSKYWPTDKPEDRLSKIVSNIYGLKGKLIEHIDDIGNYLPEIDENIRRPVILKGYEDMLDAVISALAGCYFMKKCAKPFGDNNGVIWVPKKEVKSQ